MFACLVSSSKGNTKQKFKHRTLSRSVPAPVLYRFTKHNHEHMLQNVNRCIHLPVAPLQGIGTLYPHLDM